MYSVCLCVGPHSTGLKEGAVNLVKLHSVEPQNFGCVRLYLAIGTIA